MNKKSKKVKKSKKKGLKRATDLLGSTIFEGIQRRELKEILDKEFVIKDFRIFKGQFGDYAVILMQDENTGEEFTVGTGGIAVLDKLKRLKQMKALPCLGKIVKKKRYYDLI